MEAIRAIRGATSADIEVGGGVRDLEAIENLLTAGVNYVVIGTKALEESNTKRRLIELRNQQVIEIGDRLQKLKPEVARPWSVEEVKLLLRARTN